VKTPIDVLLEIWTMVVNKEGEVEAKRLGNILKQGVWRTRPHDVTKRLPDRGLASVVARN
jgi:hypothetical protein